MKLNLCCGILKQEGYINIDKDLSVNPDIFLDIEKEKLPFENNSIDEIRSHCALEYVAPENFIFVMKEIWRALKSGGILYIKFDEGKKLDPTMKNIFWEQSFELFCNERFKNWGYYGGTLFKEIKKNKYGDGAIEIFLEAIK